MRHNDDNHTTGLRVCSRNDEANFYDSEGPCSKEELQSISGRDTFKDDFVEPPGALVKETIPHGPANVRENRRGWRPGVRNGKREKKRRTGGGDLRAYFKNHVSASKIQRYHSKLRLKY